MLTIYHTSEINQRSNNEDSLTYKKIEVNGCSEGMWMLAVADGMGGCNSGEVYSRLTVAETLRIMEETAAAPFRLSEGSRKVCPADVARAILPLLGEKAAQINRGVISAAAEADVFGGGSTLAAALVIGNCLVTFNVGDSPVYLLSGGTARELSVRDNEAEQLYSEGKISRHSEEYRKHAATLTSFIGDRSAPDPHASFTLLADGDTVILGSDGAFGNMTDATEVAEGLRGVPESAFAESLCSASAAATFDNQTVIVAVYTREKRSFLDRFRNRC